MVTHHIRMQSADCRLIDSFFIVEKRIQIKDELLNKHFFNNFYGIFAQIKKNGQQQYTSTNRQKSNRNNKNLIQNQRKSPKSNHMKTIGIIIIRMCKMQFTVPLFSSLCKSTYSWMHNAQILLHLPIYQKQKAKKK